MPAAHKSNDVAVARELHGEMQAQPRTDERTEKGDDLCACYLLLSTWTDDDGFVTWRNRRRERRHYDMIRKDCGVGGCGLWVDGCVGRPEGYINCLRAHAPVHALPD